MLDYLLDAMNEISDEHITEAVNYKAEAKKINLKKIIPIAACFVFVVAVLVVGRGFFEVAPPTTEPTHSIGSPTQAPVQSTTVAPTQCPTQKPWEDMSYGERFIDITVHGVRYICTFESVNPKRIGEYITSETVSRAYRIGEYYSATAKLYEINGITKEAFVAIKFTEDEKGEYLLYFRDDYQPETLGDLLDAIDSNNTLNFIGNSAIYKDTGYNYDGKGWSDDYIEIVYEIDAKGHKELSGLLWKNREAVCVESDYDRNPGHISVRGETATIDLEESGIFKTKAYLNIHFSWDLDGSGSFCFELDNESLKDYIAFLEDDAEIIRAERYDNGNVTPLFPELTSTTLPTTAGTTLPPVNESYSEVEKVFGTAKTLGDVIDGFDIAKADYGISGDMTVDLFAHLEEKNKEETIYSIAAATMQQLVDFLLEHKDAKAENRECQADVRLVFSVNFMGNSGRIIIGDDGYLYISCGAITKAFYMGEDAYNTFKENMIAVIWTTDNPVTFG